MADATPVPAPYDAASIQVLGDIDAVRQRPGMFVGDTGPRGLHHLIFEVVDNSIDEAMAGACKNILIKLNADGSCTVIDDGRGIPVDIHKEEGRPALEIVLTTLHAGGKFDNKAYKVSAGLHGVGVSAVNALSEWLECEVWINGYEHVQRYERGKPVTPVERRGKTQKRGTRVTFMPDKTLFPDVNFVYETVSRRLRELAFLNRGVNIQIADERSGKRDAFHFEGGIREFVGYVNHGRKPLHDEIIYFERQVDAIQVEVAMQYNESYNDVIQAFANSINTHDGGTHLTGFRTALTRTFNQWARANELFKEKEEPPTGDDYREGLAAVINVRLPTPQFESQTKVKLTNPDVEGVVTSVVCDELKDYLERHPDTARSIITKAMQATRAREAARAAREAVYRKGALASGDLPGKLADCSSRDRDTTELFIVEGDSAGGCFAGDTLVRLVDGREVSFVDLEREQEQGKKNRCFTIGADGHLSVAPIANVRRTKPQATVVRVVLGGKSEIVCTPDHRFLLQSGQYRAAEALKPGDLLMSMSDALALALGRQMGMELVNLEEMEISSDVIGLVPQAMARAYNIVPVSQESGKLTVAMANPNDITVLDDLRYMLRTDVVGVVARSGAMKAALERYYECENPLITNGPKVSSVEAIDARVDVYDLEVPETHNFALACGIFVHNSAKQGRDRRFQAILPLKGKILNVQKARDDKLLLHDEIRVLISACGAGIGADLDLSKLRYGKIIILCDADVDGSHIRTLLLTLFFGHLRPIIEGGFLYIAQPPLYKIKRKKIEEYVHEEMDLTRALLELGLEGTTLVHRRQGKSLTQEKLKSLVHQVVKIEETIGLLARKGVPATKYFAQFDAAAGRLPLYRLRRGKEERFFASDEEVNAFIKETGAREGKEFAVYVDETEIPEESETEPLIITELRGLAGVAPSLQEVVASGFKIEDLFREEQVDGELPLALVNEGEQIAVASLRGVMKALRKIGQKGLDVQRYKGLGEMNPEQLWETTMDPARRKLLKVTIEDAIRAERMFQVLMGEEVEPRRDFIERHALEVKNLDV